MARHVVSLTVNAQGAGDSYNEARLAALRRLANASGRLNQGQTPDDPGVNVDDRDPGGSGGPCAPFKYAVEVIIDQTVLPEAQRKDD